jgi:hypothetical protein
MKTLEMNGLCSETHQPSKEPREPVSGQNVTEEVVPSKVETTTPSTMTEAPSNVDKDTPQGAVEANCSVTEASTSANPSTSTPTPDEKDFDPKKLKGWPSRTPFFIRDKEATKEQREKYIYWSDLKWEEKKAYRKEFLKEYLAETKKCMPYVRRLLMMIFRISPWRAVVIFAVNIIKSLLPALTLRTRGSFIMMVHAKRIS